MRCAITFSKSPQFVPPKIQRNNARMSPAAIMRASNASCGVSKPSELELIGEGYNPRRTDERGVRFCSNSAICSWVLAVLETTIIQRNKHAADEFSGRH